MKINKSHSGLGSCFHMVPSKGKDKKLHFHGLELSNHLQKSALAEKSVPVDLRDVTGLTPYQHNKVNNCNKGSHMNFLVSRCIPKTYLHILPSTKCNSSMFINNEQILIRKFFFFLA